MSATTGARRRSHAARHEGAMMTAAQFDALAALIGLHLSPSREAARLVLVEGMAPSAAAAAAGVSRQAVSNVMRRCRAGMRLAMAATTAQQGQEGIE